jgi:hypothetical protein
MTTKQTVKQCLLLGNRFLISKYMQPLPSNTFTNKHVPMATKPHITIEELLETVFSTWSVLRCVGYVTRQINSRRLRIQRFIEHSLLHTQVQSLSLNSITWLLSLIRCLHFSGYFQIVLRRAFLDCPLANVLASYMSVAVATQWTFCCNRGDSC